MVRLSQTPITNLHLLNQRADVERLRSRVRDWEAVLETGRKVAALFPRTLQVALDIAFLPGLRRHYVLEVNAFGDQLHGVTHRGLTPYEWEIACST